MSDATPVGPTPDCLLPCHIATHLPHEAKGNPGLAWGAMVANRSIRERLVKVCVGEMLETLEPPPGVTVILDAVAGSGAVALQLTPAGVTRRALGDVDRMFGEADVKTLQWLSWLQSPVGKQLIDCAPEARVRVCLTSVDSDMLIICAMHTMLALCGKTKPCKVFLLPGGLKKRKTDALFYDVDAFCESLAPKAGKGAEERLALFLNKAWASLLPGCDFVRGFPRLDPVKAMNCAAELRPITVGIAPTADAHAQRLVVSFRPERAALVIARNYEGTLPDVHPNAGPDAFVAALRAKYKRCAANERDSVSGAAMLRSAFWTLCGYWLNAAHGTLHEARVKVDASEALKWGFEIEREKVFHAKTRAEVIDNPVAELVLTL